MSNPQLLTQVYQHPLFKETELKSVISAHTRIEIPKGTSLLSIGAPNNCYYIVEQGLIRAYVYDYRGADITTQFYTPRNVVIEAISLFNRMPAVENIHTLSDCVVWEMPFDTFQLLYHSIPAFSEWGRSWMSLRMFELKQRSIEMITLSAVDRYLKLMEEAPAVLQQAPLKHIASYLGITDSSLSRIRKEVIQPKGSV